MVELSKNYNPKNVEDRWYKYWQEEGLFGADPAEGGESACIVIPPPNVTGMLHMGHALNNAIQDALIRWWRMQGKNALWVPGTDHAGIATQNVVERKLAKENKTRDDLGREAFLDEVWNWKEDYGDTIVGQLKKLGASCDWSRERFTMDEGLSRAVREMFCRLYDEGLIYRGNYIINWCPRCQTALSDEESEHEDHKGALYHIRYKGSESGQSVSVATTRPETLLGDTALAVNPRDERYQDIIGEKFILPLLEREIPVIADDFVDPEFGTGIVKVTPAHDPNDFEMGRRHNLDKINIFNPDGTLNEMAGPYSGLDRFDCRKKLIEDLQMDGLLEKTEEHSHSIGHCYRCHTVVEPRLSPQWFVRMKPLAREAIEAVHDGRVRFVPERWKKVYLDWMENIRDWCISRQIWWGHRIPVFYCDACGKEWSVREDPSLCPACKSKKIRQDEDVMDTWFSSWLWPFSIFDWPEENKDLDFYYPSRTLVTASEIIFFWVARMIMSGLKVMGDVPFDTVYIHGTVRDDEGIKMSKSLGNSIDPLDIIEKYSADALRFSLLMITATGQDVYLSDEKFEIGRNFATKIWNAARYMQMNDLGKTPELGEFDKMDLSPDDQHIIAKLQEAAEDCTENLERCRFNDAALGLYDFIWNDFCSWYVEYSKQLFYGEDEKRKRKVSAVMNYVFSSALRLLHPFMPFITEELWHKMEYNTQDESIMRAPWPNPSESALIQKLEIQPETVEYVDAKHDLIHVGRQLRADYNLSPSQEADFYVRPTKDEDTVTLENNLNSVKALLKAGSISVDPAFAPNGTMPSGISQLGTLYMSIDGLVDVEAEMEKLKKQLAKVTKGLEKTNRKLSNENFIKKAPSDVVKQQEENKEKLLKKSRKLNTLMATLSD